MKKSFFTIVLVSSQLLANAQTVNLHFNNGQIIKFPSSNVAFVDFSAKDPDPTVSSGAVIDLGLSVFWCSCNLGAESPEEYGNYYAWGETKEKSSFSEDNYAYYDSGKADYIDIGDNIAGTEYDAATVNLGKDWRMPTNKEVEELISKCKFEWTQINGHNGFKVTGPNKNTIFLPAAGFNGSLDVGKWTLYSTSNPGANKTRRSSLHSYTTDPPHLNNQEQKYFGFSIRPVTTNRKAQGGPVDHSNDYLVTEKVSASFTGGAYTMINEQINGGSKLNVKFSNGSNEMVTLVGIQLVDGSTNEAGNNLLETEVEVAAGESANYTVTVGWAGITKPIIRFTYRYNRKKYTVEGKWNL